MSLLASLLGLLAHVVAVAALVAIAAWIAGGVLLRVGGALAVLVGLLACLIHPAGLLLVVLGALAWAAGHWLYGLRYHTYKSPLARRLFLQILPASLDPTRRWAISTTPTTNDS